MENNSLLIPSFSSHIKPLMSRNISLVYIGKHNHYQTKKILQNAYNPAIFFSNHPCASNVIKHCRVHVHIPVLSISGTLISAPFSLCEKKKQQKKRVHNFCVNILAGFLQLILAVVLIGWFWSILWAIEFLKPLKGEDYADS